MDSGSLLILSERRQDDDACDLMLAKAGWRRALRSAAVPLLAELFQRVHEHVGRLSVEIKS